jgi:hypothetical protein
MEPGVVICERKNNGSELDAPGKLRRWERYIGANRLSACGRALRRWLGRTLRGSIQADGQALPSSSHAAPFRDGAAAFIDTGPPRSRQGLTDSFFECGGEYYKDA